jgi:hypothetical protein
MSRLACAACGTEDQIATVVLPAGTNAATEALAGLVERVTFHNEENGFCVLRVKARGQRDLITVLGHSLSRDRWFESGPLQQRVG